MPPAPDVNNSYSAKRSPRVEVATPVGAQLQNQRSFEHQICTSPRDNVTTLHLAVECDCKDLVKRLILNDGIFVDVTNVFGTTPLHLAIEHENLDMVQLLLDHGADVMATNHSKGQNALHLACEILNVDIIKLLLKKNPDISKINFRGESALYIVSVRQSELLPNSENATRVLLDYGVKMANSCRQSFYFELLSTIIEDDKERALELIGACKNDDLDFSEIGAETPLIFAVCKKRVDIIAALLDHGANVKCNNSARSQAKLIMNEAVDAKCEKAATMLLRLNAPVDHLTLWSAFSWGKRDMVEKLLDRGARPDIPNEDGDFLLHKAVINGDLPTLKMLLRYNVDINCQDRKGNTSLNLSTSLKNPALTLGFVRLLLRSGANPDLPNYEGLVPLMNCVQNSHPSKLIELFVGKADFNHRDNRGRTVLHHAVAHRLKCRSLKLLLENGALTDVNSRDLDGNTPINLIADGCYANASILLQHGADLNIKNWAGEAPIHKKCALFYGGPLSFLLERLRWLDRDIGQTMSICVNHQRCLRTLGELKEITIGSRPKVTLYDVFFMSRNRLARYSENEVLKNLHNECKKDFERRWTDYGFVLNLQFKKGIIRKQLINQGNSVLQEIVGGRLPEICSETIFRYLSDSQMKVFIKEKFNE